MPLLQTIDRIFHRACVRHKRFIKDPFSCIGRRIIQNAPSFTHYCFAPFSFHIPYQYTPLLLYVFWLVALYYAANPLISYCNIIFNLFFFYLRPIFSKYGQDVKARAWYSRTDKTAK